MGNPVDEATRSEVMKNWNEAEESADTSGHRPGCGLYGSNPNGDCYCFDEEDPEGHFDEDAEPKYGRLSPREAVLLIKSLGYDDSILSSTDRNAEFLKQVRDIIHRVDMR